MFGEFAQLEWHWGSPGPLRVGADCGDWIDAAVARKGARDVIHCGPGVDRAVVDAYDVIVACEHDSPR